MVLQNMNRDCFIRFKKNEVWRITAVVAILLAAMAFIIAMESEESDGTSGKCGDKLTWNLDDDGNLTISGSGDMYSNSRPWGDGVKSVRFEGSATSIGDNAFRGCRSLTSVEIPDSG
jgi:hypothetical protein